jgi:hypothetical protein
LPFKKLNKIFSGGKTVECPECGKQMHEGRDLCETCTTTPIIDEIFILYNDGRLIDHMSRTLNPDLAKDKDIRSSMIIAVQNWIDSAVAHEIGSLEELKFGTKSVLVAQGKYLVMAIVLERGEPGTLKEVMSRILKKSERAYHGILSRWDGDKEKLHEMNKVMKSMLFETGSD